MLVVVSPAKKLDEAPDHRETTVPEFAADAAALAEIARGLDAKSLGKLMDISPKLAALNVARFAAFGQQPQKAALFSFAGDTYQGLDAQSLDQDALDWAQNHLGILSGLYGVLRPFDAIEPYRLEMGSRLNTPRGASLYQWWGARVTDALNARATAVGAKALVNCASQEYFGAVKPDKLQIPVITPVFQDEKDGEFRIISFHAKRARGAMARYIMERRIVDIDGLKDFETGGYRFHPSNNDSNLMYFRR
jgi:uncharacterized protein